MKAMIVRAAADERWAGGEDMQDVQSGGVDKGIGMAVGFGPTSGSTCK